MTPPLLLVPGLLCNDLLFRHQVDSLSADRDVTVAAPLRDDTIDAMAQRALATAPERFALAGLSLGGYVALEIVRTVPDRVDRLVLLDTNARADTPEHVAARRTLIELCNREGAVEVQRALLPRLLHPARLGEEDLVGDVLDMARNVSNEAFRNQINAVIHRRARHSDLADIRCPVSVIVGDSDVITPPEMSEEMARIIPGAELHVIPDCGHLSTMERPDAVTALLAKWLDD